jgi:hypothetical protein
MRTFAALLIASAALAAAPRVNPHEIFRAAVRNYNHDHLAALRYSYTETDNDSNGKSVSQITVIEGTPYERVLSKNGQPLTGEAERKEEEKYRRALGERANETSAQRQRRIDKYQADVKVFQEAPNAFVANFITDDTLGGRAAYVLELTPNPSYRPGNVRAKLLTKITARIWVDKEDLRIAKADAVVTDTVALGWIMARVSKGGHLEMKQIRLPDGTWVPREFIVAAQTRIFLVDAKKRDQTVTFDGFQRIGKEGAAQVSKTR